MEKTSKHIALEFCEKFQANYPTEKPLWQMMVELEKEIEDYAQRKVNGADTSQDQALNLADVSNGSYTLLGTVANLQEEKTEDCIIESAFLFENGTRLIVGTSCQYGITTYSCDKNWKPLKYACQGSPLIGFGSYTDFHKHIRKMHGEEKLVQERSSKLAW